MMTWVIKFGETDWCTKYYVTCYKWKEGKPDKTVSTPQHGNATKPTAPEYYKTDNEVLQTAKTKLESNSPSFVDAEMSNQDTPSFSDQVRNPKQLYNIMSNSKDYAITQPSEYERVVNLLKNPIGAQFVQSTVILPVVCSLRVHEYSIEEY